LYSPDPSQLLDEAYPWQLFFDISANITKDGRQLYDFIRVVPSENIKVSLRNDLVLPCPWDEGRQLDSIVNIGKGRFWGEWVYDHSEHSVELWLPMRIGFVRGGNHSISVGILQGEGYIIPNSVFDISPLYDFVYTDGDNYYRKSDNSVIAEALSVEFAVLLLVMVFHFLQLIEGNNLIMTHVGKALLLQ